jgi:hypothetical protein
MLLSFLLWVFFFMLLVFWFWLLRKCRTCKGLDFFFFGLKLWALDCTFNLILFFGVLLEMCFVQR